MVKMHNRTGLILATAPSMIALAHVNGKYLSRLKSWVCTAVSLVFLFVVVSAYSQESRVLVSVKRNYAIPKSEEALIVLDGNKLRGMNPNINLRSMKISDQHFGIDLPYQIKGDDKTAQILVPYKFRSDEPVFAFLVTANSSVQLQQVSAANADPKFELSYMSPYHAKKDDKAFADKIVLSTMHAYPNQKDLSIISPGKWTYEYGFFLNATWALAEKTNNKEYFDYVKGWVDNFITADGKWREGVYNRAEYRLDDILPGRLCISLFQKTGDQRYRKIADQLMDHLAHQPKTSEGGYWHKEIYPYQMWLDGIYMGDIFSMQYASVFNKPEWFDESVRQIMLMYKHAYDPATGLLFHGWDESKNKVWANQSTGASPELWSRAIGWYAMALVECLDYLPASHPERTKIESMFKSLCASILKFQDSKSALWYQIINQGNRKDNWIETSASGMFIYAFAKGYNRKLLDKKFLDASTRAYDAMLAGYIYADENGDVHLDQAVKVGSLNIKNSKGDYDYYINCERRLDDYKGLAALLYASIELNR
jgi:unsaturated rhamnogalacturonyl hydrolase